METKKQTVGQVILRNGFLGGVIVLYIAMVGLVEAFSERNLIGTFLSLGFVFLVAGTIAAGYLAARALEDKSSGIKLLAGLATGALTAVPLIIIAAVIDAFVINVPPWHEIFELRKMFVHLSPFLFETITLGMGLGVGSL
ncbi:MAG: hypothetical protein D6770_00140, partial [Anaerolineae bacterium]